MDKYSMVNIRGINRLLIALCAAGVLSSNVAYSQSGQGSLPKAYVEQWKQGMEEQGERGSVVDVCKINPKVCGIENGGIAPDKAEYIRERLL